MWLFCKYLFKWYLCKYLYINSFNIKERISDGDDDEEGGEGERRGKGEKYLVEFFFH